MATAVNELLDSLFDMVDEAKNMPLSGGKCVIERDKALDLIEDIKAQLPVELAEAKKVLGARNEYLAAAKREAEEMRKRAESEVAMMVNEAQVTSRARSKANEILTSARQQAKELRQSANAYCEDVLRRTEEALADAHTEMRQVHANFRSAMGQAQTAPADGQGGPRPYDVESEE